MQRIVYENDVRRTEARVTKWEIINFDASEKKNRNTKARTRRYIFYTS